MSTAKINGFRLNLQDRVKLLEWIPREKVLNEIETSGIGLLINSSKDKHSVLYTSPLKYFEYLAAGLIVLAVDFPDLIFVFCLVIHL